VIKLTQDQQAVLDGAKGPLHAEYLRRLVEWGEVFGAERLIPVESVMINGINVPNESLGDVPTELVDSYVEYAEACLREQVVVPTISHGSTMDIQRAELHDSDLSQVPALEGMLELAHQSGIGLTWTCAPYLIGNIPVKGQICAWTESHAVVYINSILGARTTRNGNESVVAAAVTGWVPEFGVLRTENRRARFVVEVEAKLESDTDWGCLGFYAGKVGGLRIPAFVGLPSPRLEAARQLCAALATSGGAPMFHIAGVTPEAPTLEAALQGQEPEESVSFGPQELANVYETLRTNTGPEIDVVYFGCPHATLQEIIEIAMPLRGKRIHESVQLVVSMAYAMEMQARRLGYVQDIEAAGGSIMTDTCLTGTLWPHPKRMATPAVKNCFYARNLLGCEVVLAPLQDCLRIAETGRWCD
jgi:predicted aconitase